MSTVKPGLIQQTSATPGTALVAIPPNAFGGYITNPLNAPDQGLAKPTVLYLSQVGLADIAANGTTIALQPGDTYQVLSNTTTPVTVASPAANHAFISIFWLA
jgi:hypothetical protein